MNEILRMAVKRAQLSKPDLTIRPPRTESEVATEVLHARVKQLEGIVARIINELGIKICDEIQTFPTIKSIIAATARYFNIDVLEILGPGRAAVLTGPRQVAMYLCKRLTIHSYPVIAKHFGGRDHTTVMHAIRKVEANRAFDAELDQAITYLSRELIQLRNGSHVPPDTREPLGAVAEPNRQATAAASPIQESA